MINWQASDENAEIKKIIDPKSGFSLYIRSFQDSPISQVSSDKNFRLPGDINTSNQTLAQINHELYTINANTKKWGHSYQNTLNELIKKTNQLTWIIFGLVGILMVHVFF